MSTMTWKNYSLDIIPQWCEMALIDHFDNMGGCWGISHGDVTKEGEDYCRLCQFHFSNNGKTYEELRAIWDSSRVFRGG